jgi:hypothetical protein
MRLKNHHRQRVIDMRVTAEKVALIARACCALLLLATTTPLPVAAEETQVSASNISDYEFDHINNQFAWGDRDGNIWIANVDPVTGDFVPRNGKGVLADTGAVYVLYCGNGPEWTYSAAGNFVTYTKYVDPNGPKDASNYGVGAARPTQGVWQGALMPGGAGYQEPAGTQNPNDPDPRLFYKVNTGSWQMLASPADANLAAGTPIPGSNLSKGSERWVPGQNEVIFTEEFLSRSGVKQRQVFLYDGKSNTTQQLTSDSGTKDAAFMWQAPEFNNAYVFFAAVNSQTIRFYRQISVGADPAQSQWQAIATMPIPAGAPKYLNSPEPFTYQGHSYVFYLRSTSTDPTDPTVPTQTWLTSLNGDINRQISDPAVSGRVRIDPEYFITEQGPYIYYNRRLTVAEPGDTVKSEGIWRSSTGLGPQATPP